MKDIKGFEGLYAVTSCGKVWSYRRQIWLKPRLKPNGYLEVYLSKDGTHYPFLLHRLVAEAYVPNPNNYPQVNHKSEIKTENFANNLCWTTAEQNTNYGTRNERAGRSLGKEVYCFELDTTFYSACEAERQTGICHQSICKCCNQKLKTAGKMRWRWANA